MIEDLKGDESWRIFRIISEFTEGIDRLSGLGFAVTIFGSARIDPDDAYFGVVRTAQKHGVRVQFRPAKGDPTTSMSRPVGPVVHRPHDGRRTW